MEVKKEPTFADEQHTEFADKERMVVEKSTNVCGRHIRKPPKANAKWIAAAAAAATRLSQPKNGFVPLSRGQCSGGGDRNRVRYRGCASLLNSQPYRLENGHAFQPTSFSFQLTALLLAFDLLKGPQYFSKKG